ncbi:MAG: pilus assembly protein TadG-related protein [Pseudomonadota bacterium]
MDLRRRTFLDFWADARGNVAIIFGIAIIPLALAAAAAVDYGRALDAKTTTQSALDAAALATAKARKSMDDGPAIAEGVTAFQSNMAAGLPGVSATPAIAINDGTVTATVQFEFTTSLMRLAGINGIQVRNESRVGIQGLGKAEVVLVLDYSSSMLGQYEAMRDGAIGLINSITDDGASADIKTGLVPFSRYVHATLDGDYVLGGSSGTPWSNCTTGRKWPWVAQSATPRSDDDSKWGRLGDDSEADITGNPNYYDTCTGMTSNNLTIRPLTTNHAGTIAQLNAMTPLSDTNVAVGAEFGYHLLSPNPPWTEGAAYSDSEWRKIMILLSDGLHNRQGFGPGGIYTSDQGFENVDHICDAMKADGIIVVTVAYDLDDEDGKDQLQRCASDSNYYLEGDETNIATVFDNIGEILAAELYLSK